MNQHNQSANNHIESYLDYYCNLFHAPQFAILLKGQWGSGKTWFIEKYRRKLKEANKKSLYVSLYGMTSFSDIEDSFFEQLHPFLSSDGVAIASKILKGLVKGTLRLDLDRDGKDDDTYNAQIPEFNLPGFLKDADKNILIFDDLERCNMELENVLGYINQFVEHQNLKVILIANEDVLKQNENYKFIKEKLIGRTFSVSPDFEGALEKFITELNNLDVGKFLSNNVEVIQEIYKKAEYENLRNLKQIVLDFERIFISLPERARNKPEILQDILKLLMAFSIEIKRGAMHPEDIDKLEEAYSAVYSKQVRQDVKTDSNKNIEQASLQKILNRYNFLNIHNLFPSKLWWQIFLDKGFIDQKELEQSVLSSKYFQDENTASWIRLWHFRELADDEFFEIFHEVESEYNSRKFTKIGEIKHIFGLLLKFSDGGLYPKTRNEILEDTKSYINHLRNNGTLPLASPYEIGSYSNGYLSLGFEERDSQEFQELSSYIHEVQELATIENLPNVAKELLRLMQVEIRKFRKMLCLTNSPDEDLVIQYHDVPVLKYIKPEDFMAKFLLAELRDREYIFWALSERYRYENINEKLIEELEWLKSVQVLLLAEANNRKSKLSGFVLRLINDNYLVEIIQKLERKAKSLSNDRSDQSS